MRKVAANNLTEDEWQEIMGALPPNASKSRIVLQRLKDTDNVAVPAIRLFGDNRAHARGMGMENVNRYLTRKKLPFRLSPIGEAFCAGEDRVSRPVAIVRHKPNQRARGK